MLNKNYFSNIHFDFLNLCVTKNKITLLLSININYYDKTLYHKLNLNLLYRYY